VRELQKEDLLQVTRTLHKEYSANPFWRQVDRAALNANEILICAMSRCHCWDTLSVT